jgi:DNA-binding CsgD family transcriptional regulator
MKLRAVTMNKPAEARRRSSPPVSTTLAASGRALSWSAAMAEVKIVPSACALFRRCGGLGLSLWLGSRCKSGRTAHNDLARRRVVARAISVYDPDVLERSVDGQIESNPARAAPDPRGLLSPREAKVLEGVALGLTNLEIAKRLDVTVHAVKFHLASVYRKLGVGNRTEAAVLCLRAGVVGEPIRQKEETG